MRFARTRVPALAAAAPLALSTPRRQQSVPILFRQNEPGHIRVLTLFNIRILTFQGAHERDYRICLD